LKIASRVIAALIVIAAALLVIGMPAGFLTSAIEKRVARDTGYRLAVAGSTTVGLWPSPNVTMSGVTLEGPGDQDSGHRFAIGRLRADMTLSSLWSGRPEISELVIDHPDLRIPLLREQRQVSKASASPSSPATDAPPDKAALTSPNIRRITVTDGTITLFNTRDHVEDHIEVIAGHATIGADRRISLEASARAGGHPVTFTVSAAMPDPSQQRQTIPAELSLQAPTLLQGSLSGKAEVRLNGSVVMINGIEGGIGDRAFDGWASIDFASKPLVKLDLDIRRLDIGTAPTQARQSAAVAWSTEPIELSHLNYVDAQLRLSATELNIGAAHFAPVALEASLASGVLKGSFSNVAAYGGQASGSIDIDVSPDMPVYALRSDLSGVRALPLLSSVAGFDSLDGKLQAKIDVRSSGRSQQAIMSNLAGTVDANFADGAIRGLNVAQMIRSLTTGMLSGWQENREQSTDLSRLSASFRIEKGQATTADLDLVGPLVKMTGAGTVDLGAQTLALRVEPKLVMTTEGQGRGSDPVAFGIPVVIDGPWTNPRIYPDVAGILDNPAAAYARLKEIGKGLFAPGGGSSDTTGNGQSNTTGGSSLGDTLGKLIQQGLDAARGRNAPDSSPNDPGRQQQNTQPLNDIMKQLFGR
jgi:AsmA protein